MHCQKTPDSSFTTRSRVYQNLTRDKHLEISSSAIRIIIFCIILNAGSKLKRNVRWWRVLRWKNIYVTYTWKYKKIYIFYIYFRKKWYNWNIFCTYFLYKIEIYRAKYIWRTYIWLIFECCRNIFSCQKVVYVVYIFYFYGGGEK